MEVIIKSIMLTLSICFIVDISGFIHNIPSIVLRHIINRKPFNCSLCLSFWLVGILSLLYGLSPVGALFMASLFAMAAEHVTEILWLIKDSISFLINKIQRKYDSTIKTTD